MCDVRKEPSQVAVAPRSIKTIENPATKHKELIRTPRRLLGEREVISSCSCNSFIETPDTNETYPGTRGSTQGDRNEMRPARKAIYIETSGDITYQVSFERQPFSLALAGEDAKSPIVYSKRSLVLGSTFRVRDKNKIEDPNSS
jgi:hypothetical protein